VIHPSDQEAAKPQWLFTKRGHTEQTKEFEKLKAKKKMRFFGDNVDVDTT